MIYFDHAATGYPKGETVKQAVSRAMVRFGANPGRGGYAMSTDTAQMLFRCREAAAELFGLSDERRVVFTSGCTHALNIVIKSLLAGGGRAVVSDWEHNAVMRPLYALSPRYPVYDVARTVRGDAAATVDAFRRAITPRTRAIICTHVSNVTGDVLPVAALTALAHEHGIPIVVDAAQSAGHLPIDMKRDGMDYMCVAGHKGLGGPMGTGLLLCNGKETLSPLIEGGTGSRSSLYEQPSDLPDRLESGTPNVMGIAGLLAGIQQVASVGIPRIATYEQRLAALLYDGLINTDGVTVYSMRPKEGESTGVISFTVEGMFPEEVSEALAQRGVASRAGLHCAPAAHEKIGTLPMGTVRFSVGSTNTREQVKKSVEILKKIIQNPLQFVGRM